MDCVQDELGKHGGGEACRGASVSKMKYIDLILQSTSSLVEDIDRPPGRYQVLAKASFELHSALTALPAQLDLDPRQYLQISTSYPFVNLPSEPRSNLMVKYIRTTLCPQLQQN